MNILLDKSKENLYSAQILIDNNCFASSVHCSYYSSVQVMLHLLLNKFNYTQKTLEAEARRVNNGSHVFAKNKLVSKMGDSNRLKAVDFNRVIGKLKNQREQADYQEEVINDPFSKKALEQANQVNGILKEVFEINEI